MAGCIQLNKVSKSFGAKTVLRDVDLEIKFGELLLVAGSNGSGKSTLLKLIAGLLPPSQGKIVLGIDSGEIGYLGHETFLYPGLTALQNLEFWLSLYGRNINQTQLLGVLKKVGLQGVMHEKSDQFSRGMAQRLTLARVLALDPRLYLLDEPETGLDKNSKEMLLAEMRQLQEKGCTILWISHDLPLNKARADAVLFLEKGQVRKEVLRGGG